MAEFRMPVLGADMEEGTLTQWLVHPGDPVKKGDIIAVVETDKSTVEVECFDTGTVGELLVEPGRRVPVRTPLAIITEPGAEPAPAVPPRAAPETAQTPAGDGPPARPAGAGGEPAPAPPPMPGERQEPPQVASPLVRHLAHQRGVELGGIRGSGPSGVITREDVQRAAVARARARVSPLARRLAAELGVDLAAVPGTGRNGAVRADDVRRASERVQVSTEQVTTVAAQVSAGRGPVGAEAGPAERQTAMRRAIARAMATSKKEIPHYYLATTIELTQALDWIRERNRELTVKERLVPFALLLKAAAVALRDIPRLNGFWADGDFVPGDGVHAGVAISLRGGGLIAPALHDTDRRPLAELMAALRDLVARTRAGRLRGSELTDATVTVTNLGDQGVETVYGVIYPPQVAMIGFGRILERPWAVGGLIGVRPVVSATLAADHRATDGYTGGRYLKAVDRLLQRPEELA